MFHFLRYEICVLRSETDDLGHPKLSICNINKKSREIVVVISIRGKIKYSCKSNSMNKAPLQKMIKRIAPDPQSKCFKRNYIRRGYVA